MNKIKKIVSVLALTLGIGLFLAPATVGAVNVYEPCTANSDSSVCASNDDKVDSLIKTIVNVMIYAIGATSIIVIIIAGFVYTTSNGEPAQIKKAKDTLTYAIAGLVIALLAYSIVNWIVDKL